MWWARHAPPRQAACPPPRHWPPSVPVVPPAPPPVGDYDMHRLSQPPPGAPGRFSVPSPAFLGPQPGLVGASNVGDRQLPCLPTIPTNEVLRADARALQLSRPPPMSSLFTDQTLCASNREPQPTRASPVHTLPTGQAPSSDVRTLQMTLPPAVSALPTDQARREGDWTLLERGVRGASGACDEAVLGGEQQPRPDSSPLGLGAEYTDRWLAGWLERSGVAQRCVGKTGNTSATVKLSELQQRAADDPAAATQLARLVRRRQKRRAAVRKRRQAERQRVLRLHRDIDTWQADIRQKEAKAKEAEQLRREADKVLGEVRRKISHVEKRLQTLEELRTLRETRDLKSRQEGLFSSAQSDQRFADVTSQLAELLDRHLATYEAELRTLEAMVAPPAAATPAPAAGPLAALRALFGAEASPAAHGVEDPHMLHMLDWEKDPSTLLSIRADWDRCLVSADNPLGSSVPPCWVVPPAPSSATWASYMIK